MRTLVCRVWHVTYTVAGSTPEKRSQTRLTREEEGGRRAMVLLLLGATNRARSNVSGVAPSDSAAVATRSVLSPRFPHSHNVVGVFRGYTSLTEHERDREGNVQMGEVVI